MLCPHRKTTNLCRGIFVLGVRGGEMDLKHFYKLCTFYSLKLLAGQLAVFSHMEFLQSTNLLP